MKMSDLLFGVFFPISGVLYADDSAVDLEDVETNAGSLDLLLFSPEEHSALPSQLE